MNKASLKKQKAQVAPPQPKEDAVLPLLGDEETALIEVEAAPLPSDGEITKVRRLAELQIEIMARIAKGEAVMKRLQEYLADVTGRQLPLAMKEIGLKDFTLMDDSRIVLEDFVVAGIKKTDREKAYAWLEKAGKGDLIKHVLTISFGKGDDAWARKFMADLAKRKKPLNVERKDDVNYQTLNAFVREEFANLRAKGIDPYRRLPKELLGIYEGTKAAAQLSPIAVEKIKQAVTAIAQKAVANDQKNSSV